MQMHLLSCMCAVCGISSNPQQRPGHPVKHIVLSRLPAETKAADISFETAENKAQNVQRSIELGR